ncbi:PFE-CTERM domain-containing protein [Oscillatoria salina]|uniref:PFE-CTERM domain-containing protein n=1 Tax=Oscillatoria salina TaxID=331517 RepID=UPI001CCA9188|nr:hypothetical protein [Oscillatoria salina]MBZ8181342.1 hypothetical protein [Oscillatoria salina IIICB1]
MMWKKLLSNRRNQITPIIISLMGMFSTAEVAFSFGITTLGSPETINFNSFNGSGFSPNPTAGQLDSDDWAITGLSDGNLTYGGTGTTGDFARGTSTGGVTTGGIYAFDVGGGNIALGIQPVGADFTPGTITLRLENNTGNTINNLAISYDIFAYNDQPRANSLNFSYSSDDSSYTNVPLLDFTSTEAAGTPSWISNPRSTTINSLSLTSGNFFYLRWTGDDVSGAGSRDEFALDNISITATGAATPVPFEFSPGLGLLILGVWLTGFQLKKCQQSK